jgi:murein DD-endopeptidase MepM/ murein hydrolase activator NlpD
LPDSRDTPLFGELLPGIKESRAGQALRLSLLRGKVETIRAEAEKTEEGMRELKAFFEVQRSILASTPSSWPVHGWVTSSFGYRFDPFTGEKSFHRGLDITTQMGIPVLAPADGQVISAVYDPNYGKMILIDHGNSVVTRFAHLSEMNVSEGDRVERGQTLGAVGNTGRSTGPHLHYEVEINGIAINPLKYILE